MKLNITVFLLKADSDLTNSLDVSAANRVTIPLGADAARFYWSTNRSRPKWIGLFESVQGADLSSATITGVRGLIVFQKHERVFCFIFGHTRHFIDSMSVERYFGLKVTLSMSDPRLIKSIDKTNIERLPLRSRDQSSKYITLSEFEFRFDWEILKSLTSVVQQDDDDYEMVSGSNSVSLYTDMVLQDIPEITDRLWSAYNDDSYRENFPWIDYIVPVERVNLDIISVCDVRPEVAQAVAEQYQAQAFSDYGELLTVGGFDLVMVLTPAAPHREIVNAASKAGHHVFCEKPLAVTLEDGKARVDACHDAGVKFFYGSCYRYLPAVRKAYELV